MADPRVLVLRAAGINCDLETRFGFEREGARADLVHVNRLLESPAVLDDYGLLVIPGGFSYGDHIAAGKVLAVELERALGDHLRRFVDRGGLMLGICNGFQVLVRTGLLPEGLAGGGRQTATLSWNDSHRYEDRWVHLRVDAERCLLAPPALERVSLPVGHGEGRFTMKDEESIEQLIRNHQAVFRYVNEDGSEPSYPADPNGSMGHIAGVCDPSGRILGLMPHPDRALFPWNHPRWTREEDRRDGDGVWLFKAAVAAMR